jgi:hypothetical protein
VVCAPPLWRKTPCSDLYDCSFDVNPGVKRMLLLLQTIWEQSLTEGLTPQAAKAGMFLGRLDSGDGIVGRREGALVLIRFFGAGDSIVDQLTSGKSFLRAMPMCDGFLAELPAQQDDLSIDFAGKIKQADVEILDLNADRIDLGEGIFGALLGLGALGFAPCDGDNIDVGSAVEKDAMGERLLFSLNFFDQILGGDRSAQQRFEHGQKRMRFVESEGAL